MKFSDTKEVFATVRIQFGAYVTNRNQILLTLWYVGTVASQIPSDWRNYINVSTFVPRATISIPDYSSVKHLLPTPG